MDDKNQNMEIDHLRYDIVCIFNSTVKEESGLSKQSVMNRINEIYLADAKGAGIKRSKLKLCKCNDDNICSNANYYCRNLLMKNIPELISLVEEYCEVRIILVDECFNKFEEYIPKK